MQDLDSLSRKDLANLEEVLRRVLTEPYGVLCRIEARLEAIEAYLKGLQDGAMSSPVRGEHGGAS